MKNMKDYALMAAVVAVAVVAGGLVLNGLQPQAPAYIVDTAYAPSGGSAESSGYARSTFDSITPAASSAYPYPWPEEKRTISSSGTVAKSFAPDEVKIMFSVETLDRSATQSQIMNADISKKVREALRAAGVADDDIETSSYRLTPTNEWNDFTRKYELKGYTTSNSITVTLKDTTMTGKVIDAGVRSGVNKVSSVYFQLSTSAQTKAKAELLAQAASAAKDKAERIASGLGARIVRLQSAGEGYSYVPAYNTYYARDAGGTMSESAAPETPISAGDIVVTVSVNAVFEVD